MYFLLMYETADDYMERRGQFRTEHLNLISEYHESGHLLMAGAMAEPADAAVLIFKTNSDTVIKEFVKKDPYIINGVVKSWEIRPWTVVVGG